MDSQQFIAELLAINAELVGRNAELSKKLEETTLLIEATVEAFNKEREEYRRKLEEKDQEIAHLKAKVENLVRIVNRFRSEKSKVIGLDTKQGNLFGDVEAIVPDNRPKEKITYERSQRKARLHPGRNDFPEGLREEIVIIEPKEDVSGMRMIGYEDTKQLVYVKSSIYIRTERRNKYVKIDQSGAETIIIGELPQKPFPKSIAHFTLIVHILVQKFVCHLPFYRQIEGFKREYNWVLPRSTIDGWFEQAYRLLLPLLELHKKKLFENGYVQIDETGLKVQDRRKKGKTHNGFMWAVYSPVNKIVYFDYRESRNTSVLVDLLKNYQGLIQSDGYSAYDRYSKDHNLMLAACMVHIRRKFVEAYEKGYEDAGRVIELIGSIYKLESNFKDLGSDQRKAARLLDTKPLLEEIKSVVEEIAQKYPGAKGKLQEAVSYALKQWPKVMNILEDGRFEMDTNLTENLIRAIALGRKNYLFGGSQEASKRIAMMYSFFGTCKAHNIDPQEWLNHVFEQIADTSIQDLEKLLPWNFKKVQE